MADTIEQILARARQTLRDTQPTADEFERIRSKHAADAEIGRLKGQQRDTLIKTGLDTGLVGGSFLSGPAGVIAGGTLALQGIKDAMREGAGTGERILAAAGALPLLGQLRRFRGLTNLIGKADDAAPVVQRGAEMFDDAALRVKGGRGVSGGAPQKRVPYQAETPFNPADAHMSNTSSSVTRGVDGVSDTVRAVEPPSRFTPNLPAEFVAVGDEAAYRAAGQADDSLRGIEDAIDRYMPNVPSNARPEPAILNSGMMDDFVSRMGGRNTGPSPATRTGTGWRNTENELLEGVDSAPLSYLDRQHDALVASARRSQPAPASMRALFNKQEPQLLDDVVEAQAVPGADEVDELIASMTVTPRARNAARPPSSFVHPADSSGAMFGFDDLPEISEAELLRLQRRF